MDCTGTQLLADQRELDDPMTKGWIDERRVYLGKNIHPLPPLAFLLYVSFRWLRVREERPEEWSVLCFEFHDIPPSPRVN